MGNLLIRRLNRQDWEQFRDVRLFALLHHTGVYGSNYDAESRYTKEQWVELLNQENNGIFGSFDKGDLVGISAAFTWRDDHSSKTAILAMWFMKEAYRGGGEFTDLVRKTMDWVENQKTFERIIVSHREGNEASRKVNQKLGFVNTHKLPETWPDGMQADQHYYERKL